jgi:hypothetical protein
LLLRPPLRSDPYITRFTSACSRARSGENATAASSSTARPWCGAGAGDDGDVAAGDDAGRQQVHQRPVDDDVDLVQDGLVRARTRAGVLGGLRRGVAEADADLVALDLVDGALPAVLGLVGALPEASGDDRRRALVQALGDVLSGLAPDVAREEEAVAVSPLSRGLVVEPRG